MALYVFSVLAPAAALAFNSHCLTDEPERGAVHVHAAKAAQDHHSDAPDDHHDAAKAKQTSTDGGSTNPEDAADKCCGVTVFSAIAPNLDVTSAPADLSNATFAGIQQPFTGIPPSKVIRPPKLQT